MPGIAGIIARDQAHLRREEAAVDSMLKGMLHEPFYTGGRHTDNQMGLCVGWVGIKGAYDDRMPVWNEEKSICLVFSGEHFAAPAQGEKLKTQGHGLGSDSAASLVHLYQEAGDRFFEQLNGWFSGFLIDLRQKQAFLFNDRYGVNRVFCHEESGGRFYFASEAKALLKVLPNLRRLDSRSAGEFLSSGSILQNRTLFQGVTSLPPASVVRFGRGESAKRSLYFNKQQWENQPKLGVDEYYEKLKATWIRILPGYLNGSTGLSLTGGVDSRMILAWAPQLAETLPCYTYSGRYRDCADVAISRRLAGLCHQSFQTIPIGEQFLKEFPALCEKTVYVSDGAMDTTGTIDLYVQRRARQIAPVRVSGVYGGEILRCSVAFKPGNFCQGVIEPELLQSVQQAADTYGEELQGDRLSFIAFKQAPWYMTAKFMVERSQVTMRTPYFDNELVALAFQTPPEISNFQSALRLIDDGNPALSRVPTDRGLLLNPVRGLTYAQHLFHEFTFKAEYAYDYGMPQWLAAFDHLVAPLHLERLFLGRHKFHHFRVFFRDELAHYLKEILLDEKSLTRPYIRRKELERMVYSHTSGQGNYTMDLHGILSLELVHRVLLESN